MSRAVIRGALIVLGAVAAGSWLTAPLRNPLLRRVTAGAAAQNVRGTDIVVITIWTFGMAILAGGIAGFLVGCVARGGSRAQWLAGLFLALLLWLWSPVWLHGLRESSAQLTSDAISVGLAFFGAAAGFALGKRTHPRGEVA
jgi:hypothetical protein